MQQYHQRHQLHLRRVPDARDSENAAVRRAHEFLDAADERTRARRVRDDEAADAADA